MRRMNIVLRLAATAILVGTLAVPAVAQLQTGSIYGTVKDDKGSPLPGVTVMVSSIAAFIVSSRLVLRPTLTTTFG